MLDVVIVGAGPASIGLLSSILRKHKSDSGRYLKACVVDSNSFEHLGRLADYNIPSDTRAEKFLTCLDGLPTCITAHPEVCDLTNALQSFGSKAAPLPIVGEFYRALGQKICENMASKDQLDIKLRTNVSSAQWHNNHWQISTHSEGVRDVLLAKNLVLACGATESQIRLDKFLSFYGLTLDDLNAWQLSSGILKAMPEATIFQNLQNIKAPQVVIIGGSHSAISAAAKLLSQNIPFGAEAITIFHRSPMHVTFENAQSARQLGFNDFDANDICPHTQRVYALKGFRLDSRDLLMAVKGYGEKSIEDRVILTPLKTVHQETLIDLLRNADLVVSALGYEPDYIPLYTGNEMKKISLNAPHFVDDASRLLDDKKSPIPNCYALGLASNYSLAGRFGEPSFRGQANGLVLWHKDIGMDIASSLMESIDELAVS